MNKKKKKNRDFKENNPYARSERIATPGVHSPGVRLDPYALPDIASIANFVQNTLDNRLLFRIENRKTDWRLKYEDKRKEHRIETRDKNPYDRAANTRDPSRREGKQSQYDHVYPSKKISMFALSSPLRGVYKSPKYGSVCLRRVARRRALFAMSARLSRTGKGSGKTTLSPANFIHNVARWKPDSYISCRRRGR